MKPMGNITSLKAILQRMKGAAPARPEPGELPRDFDGALYLQLNPDVLAAAADPVEHYLLHGRNEGRLFKSVAAHGLPAGFNAQQYLALNPDLLAISGLDPAQHYLLYGQSERRVYETVLEVAAVTVGSPADTAMRDPLLPHDFDPETYRKLHPDLHDPAIDPTEHYLHFGRQEGRSYTYPALDLFGADHWRAERDTVMVVSHEASRTGAPVLSLNLVQSLAARYNVVAVLLGGGALEEAFRLSGAIVTIMPAARGNSVLAEHLIEQLSARYTFKFALVNSIVSRIVLAPLAAAYVPVISLVHEFASYTRPRNAFRDALLWSGEVVFSARVTMENAFAEYPDLGQRSAHILPQGRCLLPEGELNEEDLSQERARLRRLIRPPHANDAVVVLGAGFVQLRKGVELFLECAARVARSPGGERCRFVWIGKGYEPDEDVLYSVYLADQVRRAGLQKQVIFIDETSAIDTAYEESDLLLLSSRLDPLPNVAIDAIASGVPVLCFDKTTGIADFLIESGLRAYCVAEYLDTGELAAKVLALAGDTALRVEVAARGRDAADAYFNMAHYVASLERLAIGVAARSEQEREDVRTIVESGLFQPALACAARREPETTLSQVRRYVRAWASGIDRRHPYPGFHPGIYLERHGVVAGADPFADYVRAGQPPGAWNYPLVKFGTGPSVTVSAEVRVALHLHVYYPELLPEMLTRLAYNRTRPDLFISIKDEASRAQVEAALAGYAGRVAALEAVPNRGRDIGPFLTAFSGRLMAGYDIVGHMHTKKSTDVKDASMGTTWYRFLLENLLGGVDCAAMDDVMAAMQADASVGMVFPVDPYVLGMGANREFALVLAERLGLGPTPEHFLFPVGSMFWARPAALAPVVALGLDWDDYPDEPLPYDGSILHALERFFALSLPLSGLHMAATHICGVTR